MVDCRLCKFGYKLWNIDLVDEDLKHDYKLVCLRKEVFIDWKYIANGPCDLYVDVDGDVPGDRDL